jgi:hypothetical protein
VDGTPTYPVDGEKDGVIYQSIKESHPCGKTEIHFLKPPPVDVGRYNIRRLVGKGIIEENYLFITFGHDITQSHDELNHDNGDQGRHSDMPNLREPARPIYRSSFVKIRIYRGKGRQVNYAAPSHILPNPADHVNKPEISRNGEKAGRLTTEKPQNDIKDSPGAGKIRDQTTYHHG